MAERTLDVIINGKDNLSKTLKDTEKSVSKVSQSFEKSTKASKRLTLGIAALATGFVALARKAVIGVNEEERAFQRLNTLLLNVAGNTKEHAKELIVYANALERVTTVEGDATVAGQSQLATFMLQTNTIKTLTPAMLDLAVAVNGVNVEQDDMIAISNLVGKAMMGQTGALTRYGVTMTEAQIVIMQTGTEAEKAATMVDILGQNFGGLAEAMRETTEGQLRVAINNFNTLLDIIGRLLQPIVQSAVGSFNSLANAFLALAPIAAILVGDFSGLQAVFAEYADKIQLVTGAILGMMAPAVISWVMALGAALAANLFILAPWAALGAAVVLLYQLWQENFMGIQDRVDDLRKDFDRFTKEVQKNALLISAAIKTAFFGAFAGAADTLRWFWQKYGSDIEDGIKKIREGTGSMGVDWGKIGETMRTKMDSAWQSIKQASSSFWQQHKTDINGGIEKIGEWSAKALELFGKVVAWLIEKFGAAWTWLADAGQQFWDKYGEDINGYWERVKRIAEMIWTRLQEIWDRAREPLGRLMAAIGGLVEAFAGLFGESLDSGTSAFETLLNWFLKGAEFFIPLFVEGLTVIIEAIEKMVGWIKTAIDWWGKLFEEANKALGVKGPQAQLGPKAQAAVDAGRVPAPRKFASGGIVPGFLSGDSVSALLTPGEEVLTANDPRHSRNGGGGLTVNVNGTFYGADKRFAEQVGDMIAQKLRFATNYAR